jgi:hypothetical protein
MTRAGSEVAVTSWTQLNGATVLIQNDHAWLTSDLTHCRQWQSKFSSDAPQQQFDGRGSREQQLIIIASRGHLDETRLPHFEHATKRW